MTAAEITHIVHYVLVSPFIVKYLLVLDFPPSSTCLIVYKLYSMKIIFHGTATVLNVGGSQMMDSAGIYVSISTRVKFLVEDWLILSLSYLDILSFILSGLKGSIEYYKPCPWVSRIPGYSIYHLYYIAIMLLVYLGTPFTLYINLSSSIQISSSYFHIFVSITIQITLTLWNCCHGNSAQESLHQLHCVAIIKHKVTQRSYKWT